MNYKQRRQLIQQLVEENHIATQEELLELLSNTGSSPLRQPFHGIFIP